LFAVVCDSRFEIPPARTQGPTGETIGTAGVRTVKIAVFSKTVDRGTALGDHRDVRKSADDCSAKRILEVAMR